MFSKLILVVGILNVVGLGFVMTAKEDACRELVEMKKAEQVKAQTEEQQMRDFFSNKGKPIPPPVFTDKGL